MNIIGILTFSNGEKIRFKARRKGTHKNKCRSCLFSPQKNNRQCLFCEEIYRSFGEDVFFKRIRT